MSSLHVIDLIRLVAVGLGAALVGLSAVVVRFYFLARRLAPSPAGLLPSHVWKIGVSYLLFVAGAVTEVMLQLDDPLNWRLPYYGLAALIGLWALSDLLRYERRRVRFGRTKSVVIQSDVVEVVE